MIYGEEIQFDKADELVDFLMSTFRTTNLWQTNTPGQRGYIFRGQSDASWSLKPTVFRSHEALNDFDQQTPGEYDGSIPKENWLSLHIHAELRSVFTFLELADKLGIETPINYTRLADHKELMTFDADLSEFNKPFPDDHTLHTLEELALAQHHGVPTRLLDWTESPLIACFFAALNVSSVALQKVNSSNIAVVALDLNAIKNSEEIKTVNAVRHRNNNLLVQKGIFVHMPLANAYFIEHERWPSLEDIICKSSKLSGSLRKYCLPAVESDSLLRILYDYDITTYKLMPSLDNIAGYYKYDRSLFPIT